MKKVLLSAMIILNGIIIQAQAPAFQWAKQMQGSTVDAYNQGNSVTVDKSGNVYSTGYFIGTVDFDPGTGTESITSSGSGLHTDAFISKLDAAGNLVWTKNIGGTKFVEGNTITTDAAGNVYVTGSFSGTADFDPNGGIDSLTADSASSHIFILKLDTDGSFAWAKNIGGTGTTNAHGNSIILDAAGNIYTTGIFQGTVDFDPGAGISNLNSGGTFILKLDGFGNFVWAKSVGGNGNSITVDALNNVYITGGFQGTADFDPGAGTFDLTATGYEDIFISKLDGSGNFIWAKSMRSTLPGGSEGKSIITDNSGNIYTTGFFEDTVDFDPGPGVAYLTGNPYSPQLFISKLDASGNFVWVKNMTGTGGIIGYAIALDKYNTIYTTGTYSATIDFDPGPGVFNLSSSSGDEFISKLDAFGNFISALKMGGPGASTAVANSIAIDTVNNIYTTGYFNGTVDFDPGAGIFNLTSSASTGGNDIFVEKLNQPSLGINEYDNSNNISIYPNPTNGIFNIIISGAGKNTSIELYNSIGSLIYSIQKATEQTTVDLTDQANGIYFIKVMSDDKIVSTKKIIKE